jgi:hypothetical protein
VPGIFRKLPDYVKELARVVLVDKQKLQPDYPMQGPGGGHRQDPGLRHYSALALRGLAGR